MNQGVFYGQIVIGPAGSGKLLKEHGEISRRTIIIANLDPAAENFYYEPVIDIRDLITVEDVMEELNLGPNGALLYCFKYLLQNLEWLDEQLQNIAMDDYIIFDCPGQIELYTHLEEFGLLITHLQNYGFSLCSLYLMDITFLGDDDKFISGLLAALSAQVNLGLPHITLLTKCDLVKDKSLIQKYLGYTDELELNEESLQFNDNSETTLRTATLKGLTAALRRIVAEFGLISLKQLNINDEDTITSILDEADFGENLETNPGVYDAIEKGLEESEFTKGF